MPERIARPGPLGCADHQAIIRTRGGRDVVDYLQWSSMTYGRKLDDTSTASVTLNSSQALDCREIIAKLKAWKYELAITRGRETVWTGPLRAPHYEPALVTVNASDLFAWFDWRFLAHDRHFQTDLADIFVAVVNDALADDPSPNIRVRTSPTGIHGVRDISGVALARAADVLRELSRTGLDWTMVAREMRIGGTEVPTAPLATLVDDTLRNVAIDPVEGVSECFVFGAPAGTERLLPVFGEADDIRGDIGTVQMVVNEPTIGDNASATAAARTRIDFYAGEPIFVTGTLHPSAPIDFADLVPGARIDVALNHQTRGPVVAPLRLTSVDVTVTSADQGNTEDVKVSLAPLGTVAA